MVRITATINVKLVRSKKFRMKKINKSIIGIFYDCLEKGTTNVKPKGTGPLKEKFYVLKFPVHTDLNTGTITIELKLRLYNDEKETKALVEELKIKLRKELQSLGLYKITIQKTQY